MRDTPMSDRASTQLETMLGTRLVACRFRTPGVRSTATWHFAGGCVFAVDTFDLGALDLLRYAAHHEATLTGWTGSAARFTADGETIDLDLCGVELLDDPTPW